MFIDITSNSNQIKRGSRTMMVSLSANGAQEYSVTVPGAVPGVGAYANAQFTASSSPGLTIESVWVSAIDQVTVRLRNWWFSPTNTEHTVQVMVV